MDNQRDCRRTELHKMIELWSIGAGGRAEFLD